MSKSSKSAGENTLAYALYILLAFAGGIAMAYGIQQWRSAENNSINTLAAYGGDFVLEAPWGASGLADYRGKMVMIYFGFATCPDVCPTSLGVMKAAMKQLDENEQANVSGLFITIDPERDTPKISEDYAQYFHKNFHGLSGPLQNIQQIAKSYGVLFRKVKTADSAIDYTMDHSSVIYIVDQQGVLRSKLQHGVTPKEVADELRKHLKS